MVGRVLVLSCPVIARAHQAILARHPCAPSLSGALAASAQRVRGSAARVRDAAEGGREPVRGGSR